MKRPSLTASSARGSLREGGTAGNVRPAIFSRLRRLIPPCPAVVVAGACIKIYKVVSCTDRTPLLFHPDQINNFWLNFCDSDKNISLRDIAVLLLSKMNGISLAITHRSSAIN